MSSDTHADTIPPVDVLYWSRVMPTQEWCVFMVREYNELADRWERERARADRAEAKFAATDEWVTKVSLQSTEAATYADRLAEAVRAWDADLSEYCDGPLRDEVRAALSAGSGGRETTP